MKYRKREKETKEGQQTETREKDGEQFPHNVMKE
jgi:hypothetical protein